ncbi:Mitochondrial ribosome small subunit biogenesis protein [Saxophila tyrrhenica]|uniref:Mitochondrial ribosome small subunit biogenesis protein n=1 Tax=Saxophila tyrrhenica TaxID=1690608 RepID=A0AAV9PMX1_9PEZI|nr:Mitochondrial ribosome small subunit biogenesis protein [Saxophila tyrrhenica]
MLASLRAARKAVSPSPRLHLRKCSRSVSAVALACRATWPKSRGFSSFTYQRDEALAANDGVGYTADLPPGLTKRADTPKLPVVCPGCGAPSQTVDPDVAGFYGSKRALKETAKSAKEQEEDEVFSAALQNGLLSEAVSKEPAPDHVPPPPAVPICDRCHDLLYQSKGNSIIHPSMQSIQQIIEESPHKQNHIYHVLDAADFPLSLIPNLVSALQLPRLRTQNRRSKSMHYVRGRVAEVSFIITRSDLLAPKKEQVDSLVPYLREVLRDALGRSGRNLRLGNVRCVSAHRGWWTRTVKEEIWNSGGAGWVVGKVNVGKSALFEVVFPKGRKDDSVNVRAIREEEKRALGGAMPSLQPDDGPDDVPANVLDTNTPGFANLPGELHEPDSSASATQEPNSFQETELDIREREHEEDESEGLLDDTSLLPPAQPETAYPRMPLVSSLPGTTASPIRIPFGGGKGELIDLPGIHRSSLDVHVQPEHRVDLVMKSRVVPQQHTIKPGQSLLLGGLIRITPQLERDENVVMLAYPFTPLKPHVTSSDKAVAIQTGSHPDTGESYSGTVATIATTNAQAKMKEAGTFQLRWDVTKRRAGPLTDPAAGKQKAANLPFIVYGADILIEGVGWVELTCQVRARRTAFVNEPVKDAFGEGTARREFDAGPPEVEVWSPNGGFVGIRRPMNAWLLGGPKKTPKHARRGRPRQTISMQRRKEGGARNQNGDF